MCPRLAGLKSEPTFYTRPSVKNETRKKTRTHLYAVDQEKNSKKHIILKSLKEID